ncbi:hypothetical protein V8E54_006327 [Elaphomyces granulatus]|jgi:hypothetical protein
MLVENGPMPDSGYDVNKFNDLTTVAIEASVLAYHMDGREPGFSVAMQGIYYLGTLPHGYALHAWKTEGRLYHQPEEAEECFIYCGFVEGLMTIEKAWLQYVHEEKEKEGELAYLPRRGAVDATKV